MRTAQLDRAGMALSLACLLHCLALPLMGVALPVFGVLAEIELIHRMFAALAALAAIFAFARPLPPRNAILLRSLAMAGVVALICGAFIEVLHDYETGLTVLGALLLGTAHILRSRALHAKLAVHMGVGEVR